MTFGIALAMVSCSSGGGRQATSDGGGANVGSADTPRLTIAMVTHAEPGQIFWDVVRKGADMAAKKDNIDLQYANDWDATKQAQLIQAAIDKKVDGLIVTDPNTPTLGPAIQKAVAAGIPVTMINAGGPDAMELGAIGFFGQPEKDAGVMVGKRLKAEGATNILCVNHTAGMQQLADRCDGVKEGSAGVNNQLIYVNGTDDSAVTTAIQAKLTQDPTIDAIATLTGSIAFDAVKSVSGANSKAKIATFDANAQLVDAIRNGTVAWAVDQQPYLQGYMSVDSLWLYITNRNTLGGGAPVATGPAFVDKDNLDTVAALITKGTR
jgi:simple sugar transport system substrate-binding protein